MKKKIINIAVLLSALSVVVGCSDWTESEAVDYFKMPDADYYENLRNYKKSDHMVTFGWFGNWTATGASLMNSMSGLPDSVDFVSLWSDWRLNDLQMADKQEVKRLKGTRMKLCFIITTIGDRLTPQEVLDTWEEKGFASQQAAMDDYWGWVDDDEDAIWGAIQKFAKALSDICYEYDYDGFDWDLEPSYAQPFPTPGASKFWKVAKRRNQFIEALSVYFGPRSGTGRTLGVDGEPYLIDKSLFDAMDWFICQAYACSGYSNLDTRVNEIVNNYLQEGVTKQDICKKIIMTENFESYATNGGVSHALRGGGSTNSLSGMALYRTVEGYRLGGIGSFHMEYDYPNVPEYKWLRMATNLANPPVK